MDDLDAAINTMHDLRRVSVDAKDAFEDSVTDVYRAGAPLRRLATELGMTVEGVRTLLKRRGVQLRPPHVR